METVRGVLANSTISDTNCATSYFKLISRPPFMNALGGNALIGRFGNTRDCSQARHLRDVSWRTRKYEADSHIIS